MSNMLTDGIINDKILGKQLKDLEGILGIRKHSILSQTNAGQDDYEKYYQEYQKICQNTFH